MIGVLEATFSATHCKNSMRRTRISTSSSTPKGRLRIWRNRTVVEDGAVEDPNAQIAVSRSRPSTRPYEIGDEYADEIKLVVRPPRRVVAAPEPRLAHSRSGEGQPLREVFRKGRRDRHRRSLSGMEKEVLILDDEENELILPKAGRYPTIFTARAIPSRPSSSRSR